MITTNDDINYEWDLSKEETLVEEAVVEATVDDF